MSAPEVITRAEWGARDPKWVAADLSNPDALTGHYQGSTSPSYVWGDLASESAAMRRTQNFHMDVRGWSDFAYSWGISQGGRIFEGRGWGRRTAAQGSTEGNDRSHAAYFMLGGSEPPTDEAKAAFVYLIETAPDVAPNDRGPTPNGLAVPDRPGLYVNGHKDWKPTGCPGAVYPWLQSREWEELLVAHGFDTAAQAAFFIALHEALTADPLPAHPNSSAGQAISANSIREFFEAIRFVFGGLGVDLRGDEAVRDLGAKLRAAADKLEGIIPAEEAHTHDDLASAGHDHGDGDGEHHHPQYVTTATLDVHAANPDAHHE